MFTFLLVFSVLRTAVASHIGSTMLLGHSPSFCLWVLCQSDQTSHPAVVPWFTGCKRSSFSTFEFLVAPLADAAVAAVVSKLFGA